MSYVSSRKSPCHPSVTQCHLRPPAQSHLGDRVQEWHTSPTATHKATVDSFTMPVPGPHGSLAQTCYTHEAKVVATQPHCVQASPQSVPYVHTTTGALPFMAALACVRTQAPYCYLAVSPCLQGQLSHMLCQACCCAHAQPSSWHLMQYTRPGPHHSYQLCCIHVPRPHAVT